MKELQPRRSRCPYGPGSGRLVYGLLAAMAIASPVAASAQDRLAADPPGGWIGIGTDTLRLYLPGSDEPTLAIRVAALHVSGPAELGGVLPGDLLLAWDGRALDTYETWTRSVADLDPGQQVILRLMRDGVEREVTVVATDWPTEGYEVRLDMTDFDSVPSVSDLIRDFLANRQGTLAITSGTGGASGIDSASLTIIRDDSSMTVGYERVQVSPDSRIRSGRIQGIILSGVESAAARDTADLRAGAAGVDSAASAARVDPMGFFDSLGPQFRALRAPPIPLEPGRDEVFGRPFSRAAEAEAFPVPPFPEFIGAMGSVVLGGAQVWSLSGELGRYFEVEKGILVLDVISMSPARRAGFRPGDAIVAVAGDEVGTLAQLTAYLSVAELPVQVTVVRRGERVELTYPVR